MCVARKARSKQRKRGKRVRDKGIIDEYDLEIIELGKKFNNTYKHNVLSQEHSFLGEN